MNNNEQLFKILTHAQVNAVKSLQYFEYSQEKEKEGNTEIANNYWSTCQDYDGRARGLLEAYKIMTGKSILPIPSHINDEMLIVQDDILKDFDTWTDKLIERIAKAYQEEDCDKYEDLLDEYSYDIPSLRNMLEDRVTDYRVYDSHCIG